MLNYEAWIPTLALWNRLTTGQDNQDPAVQQTQISLALCPAIQQVCHGCEWVAAVQVDLDCGITEGLIIRL